MPIVEEMQSLAQEIVRSYGDRISGIAQLREAGAERKQAAAQEIGQRRCDVSGMLKGCDDAHAAMSQELKADLAQEIGQRQSDVSAELRGFREEQAGARDAWQKLAATMRAKRGAPATPVKTPGATAPSRTRKKG